MKNQLLRHCCSRGIRDTIQSILKVMGLGWSYRCSPYIEDNSETIISTNSFSQATYSSNLTDRRILYLIHKFYPEGSGGTEIFLEQLASKQLALGKQVCIVTLSTGFSWEYPEKIKGMLVRRYTWNGIEVIAIRYQKPQRGLYYKRIDESEAIQDHFAKYLLDQFNPDIVHAVYPQPFASFLRVCREKHIPYLITATDFSMICPRGTLMEEKDQVCQGSQRGSRCHSDRLRFEKAERMLCGSEFITVPSEFLAKRFASEMPELQSIIVPHDIETTFCHRDRSTIKHFAFFGRLTWSKGVFLLAKAFHKLHGDFTLDIYGDGPLCFLLKQYCLIDNRIRIRGQVSRKEIPTCYDYADCVVIPSRVAESYSLVLSEALASGCMVIASDLGALPQRVKESGSKIFRSGNIEELYGALQNAVESPVFPLKEVVSSEIEADAYEALYRKVVKK